MKQSRNGRKKLFEWIGGVILAALMSPAAFGACSNTSYGQGTTCVQVQTAGGLNTNINTKLVNITTTAGHQVLLNTYWCAHNVADDCTAPPSETASVTCNVACSCWQASPSSPLYLVETGAQKIGNYAFACPNIPSGVTSITITYSANVDYPTIVADEWTGLNTGTSMFDTDAGFGSTAAAETFTASTQVTGLTQVTHGAAKCTNDLLTTYLTTINDNHVTFTTPSSSLEIVNVGGTKEDLLSAVRGHRQWLGTGPD